MFSSTVLPTRRLRDLLFKQTGRLPAHPDSVANILNIEVNGPIPAETMEKLLEVGNTGYLFSEQTPEELISDGSVAKCRWKFSCTADSEGKVSCTVSLECDT